MAEAPDTKELTEIVEAVEAAESMSEVSKALKKVKEGLHSVKVSKHDATELQRKLEGELFDKWEESCEVMEANGIPIEDIQKFLDHMRDSYEGIDDDMRKKMNGIEFAAEWAYKVIEFKYNKRDNSGARYGMLAFGKSADKKYVDCMYVLYKMDFKIAPKEIVTTKDHSALWGLFKWQTTETQTVERTLGVQSIKLLQNFFRVKALQGFYNNGLIDTINYVPCIEDVETE